MFKLHIISIPLRHYWLVASAVENGYIGFSSTLVVRYKP